MSNRSLRKIMPLACILWICLIFALSSDSDSSKKTIAVSEEIHYTTEAVSTVTVKQINFVLRKCSHFLEYLVLCILLLKTADVYRIRWKQAIPYVLLACLLLANLDEFYQSFMERDSMVRDCLIDFGGSLTGLAVYVGARRWLSRRAVSDPIK